MKEFHIFVGSSLEELRKERREVYLFCKELNQYYQEQGFHLECYLCEHHSTATDGGGSQGKYNEYLREKTELALFLFKAKTGEYTLQEIECARQAKISKGVPDILVCFLQSQDGATLENVRSTYKEMEDKGIPCIAIQHVDEIKWQILERVSSLFPGRPAAIIRDGKVFCGEKELKRINANNLARHAYKL